jgi:hypothetical protein
MELVNDVKKIDHAVIKDKQYAEYLQKPFNKILRM